jgi:uncharacterized membrane protein
MKRVLAIFLFPVLLLMAAGLVWGISAEFPSWGGVPVNKEPNLFFTIVRGVVLALEGVGTAVIVGGALLTIWYSMRGLRQGISATDIYYDSRGTLGRAILLGLEFFVAGDIIRTVAIDQTFSSLGVLGLVVLIRTFLSFALEVELNGHWPWKESELSRRRAREGG